MNSKQYYGYKRGLMFYRRYIHQLNQSRVADFPATYASKDSENYWNEVWKKHEYFTSNEESASLKMILPPPNITGVLHLGHALTITIQDVLARWYRMRGESVLWVPGLDHAGIATQVAVEKYLWATKNVSKYDIGREAFLTHIEQWKSEKGNKINNQLKKLGASLDWSKEYFTMSNDHNKAITEALIKLDERDLLYRKNDLINWCPSLRSTVSDIEVDYLDVNTKTEIQVPGYDKKVTFGEIVDVAFKLEDSEEKIVVSTTRVETMSGDVAIAVHPDDPRYSKYIGKQVWHPLRQLFIPIIQDIGVKQNYGTGAVKITPAHDRIDFEISQKHGLDLVQVIDEDGKMMENTRFEGLLRFEAKKKILDELLCLGALERITNHPMSIPICSRSGDVIEFLMKEQWFVKLEKMAQKALHAVKNKEIKIIPDKYEELWFDKMNNIRDWCISRQVWWGHRIPAYSCQINNKKEWIVAHDAEEAQKLFKEKYGISLENIEQDSDVLDTWFSAALLPLTAMGWPHKDYSKFYPLDLMETGHDILFHWVGRMAMICTELSDVIPFKEVLLHGIMCDSRGRKMSKSLGNVILPEYVVNGISRDELDQKAQESFSNGILTKSELKRSIASNTSIFPQGIYECGTDALRFTLLAHNIKNEKIRFNIIEGREHKFFCNKIWQACRYILLITDDFQTYKPDYLSTVDKWILNQLSVMVDNLNRDFRQKDFYKAIASIKQFFYYEFCDVYLEVTKIGLSDDNQELSQSHRYTLIKCLEVFLRALAPIMPYISEELYFQLGKKFTCFQKTPSIITTSFPTVEEIPPRNKELESHFNEILNIVLNVRNNISNIDKKSIKEIHIVLSESKNLKLYEENINFFIGTIRTKNLKIYSSNNYIISENSIYTTENDCHLYYLLSDANAVTLMQENMDKKKKQKEKKNFEKLSKKNKRQKLGDKDCLSL